MEEVGKAYYVEHLQLILLFGLIGLLLNRFASKRGFYSLPLPFPFDKTRLVFLHVLVGFGFYLFASAYFLPFVLPLARGYFSSAEVEAAWCQVLVLLLSYGLIFLGSKWTLKQSFSLLWKAPFTGQGYVYDVWMGFLTWFLGFPIVVVVEQIADMFVYGIFGVQTYEQVAVRYLKQAFALPQLLFPVLLLILIVAPFLEEFLFRGLLQSWLKKHLGTKASILLASLCFALFHFSFTHGVGNFSLIPSLFTFSCFLGFIYERQKSLMASTILHVTFNLVTTLRIYFMASSL